MSRIFWQPIERGIDNVSVDVILHTDASGNGWGGSCEINAAKYPVMEVMGSFTETEKTLSMSANHRELLGGKYTLFELKTLNGDSANGQ